MNRRNLSMLLVIPVLVLALGLISIQSSESAEKVTQLIVATADIQGSYEPRSHRHRSRGSRTVQPEGAPAAFGVQPFSVEFLEPLLAALRAHLRAAARGRRRRDRRDQGRAEARWIGRSCCSRCRSRCSALGLVGVMIRRNALVLLMCMELMLNGVILSLVTFAAHSGHGLGRGAGVPGVRGRRGRDRHRDPDRAAAREAAPHARRRRLLGTQGMTMNLLTLIVLLPLAGFVLNGLLGNRLGKGFVSVVGCGLPIARLPGHGAGLPAAAGHRRQPRWSRPPTPGRRSATSASRSPSTSTG